MSTSTSPAKHSSFEDEDPYQRSHKRRKIAETSPTEDSESDTDGQSPEAPRVSHKLINANETRILSHVQNSALTRPRSAYVGWEPPLPRVSEQHALDDLKEEWTNHSRSSSVEDESGTDFINFELSNFRVYRERISHARKSPNAKLEGDREMCVLHNLSTKVGYKELLFDGIITYGNVRRYVEAVPFETLSVEGYADLECHSAESKFIQSKRCAQDNLWLRLGTPSPEYQRYYDAFLWVASFGKHFVDFLLEESDVVLEHFRTKFHDWMKHAHGQSSRFQDWWRQCQFSDFRGAVIAYYEYLWKEATSIERSIRQQPIWAEVDPKDPTAIPTQKPRPAIGDYTTIVTPYIFECFKHLYFGELLQVRHLTNEAVKADWQTRKSALNFPTTDSSSLPYPKPPDLQVPLTSISKGDIVGVRPDEVTRWKSKASVWYIYVRDVLEDDQGRYVKGTWLCAAEDTTIATMYYPYKNELFMSDICNCKDSTNPDNRIYTSDLISKVNVIRYPKTIPGTKFFVRQTYHADDQSFRTLKQADLLCCKCPELRHNKFHEAMRKYSVYDTILAIVHRGSRKCLEPFVIQDFIPNLEIDSGYVEVRRLLRAKRDLSCATARPNELVWTNEITRIKPGTIVRQCSIRFHLKKGSKQYSHIPPPYDRDGQVDYFFVSKRLCISNGRQLAVDLENDCPGAMKSGRNFTKGDRAPLDTLSLFSGGGNFDRGVEEGGAIHTRWSVEWDKFAAHTYRANMSDPNRTGIFMGPCDEHLARGIDGKRSDLVPSIGEVEVLLGGSPCQGFSKMQANRYSLDSMRNASKVASVAAYIDLYRPRYAILENVADMARQCGKDKDENVFSQMLGALVGMGYQAQQFLLDSWSYGDPQKRSRLFIVATAPGLTLMEHPPLTHGHPLGEQNRSLGKAPNGLPFGERLFTTTAFEYTSAAEATNDLPDVHDGHVETCISFPDHKSSRTIYPHDQQIIKLIPVHPPGQGLISLAKRLDVPEHILQFARERGGKPRLPRDHAFSRVDGKKLFPTIVTAQALSDFKNGFCIHWEQDRVLTIMEARRAQGFPDDEVLVGPPSRQWKIVGNSVARSVALAIGVSLRDAWLSNKPTEDPRVGTLRRVNDEPSLEIHVNATLPGSSTDITLSHDSSSSVIISNSSAEYSTVRQLHAVVIERRSIHEPQGPKSSNPHTFATTSRIDVTTKRFETVTAADLSQPKIMQLPHRSISRSPELTRTTQKEVERKHRTSVLYSRMEASEQPDYSIPRAVSRKYNLTTLEPKGEAAKPYSPTSNIPKPPAKISPSRPPYIIDLDSDDDLSNEVINRPTLPQTRREPLITTWLNDDDALGVQRFEATRPKQAQAPPSQRGSSGGQVAMPTWPRQPRAAPHVLQPGTPIRPRETTQPRQRPSPIAVPMPQSHGRWVNQDVIDLTGDDSDD